MTLSRKNIKHLILGLAVLGSLALAAPTFAAPARLTHPQTPDKAVTCRQAAAIPVALSPGQPASYTVSGELCSTAAEQRAGTTVQLLIPGATYTHTYWDFGTIDGIEYSYARDVAARGFPTFAVDGIGSGSSSHPPSNQLTIQAVAYVTHQIVQGLRSGSVTGVRFGRVITVGHSLGSVAVWQEAVSFGDVDGLIITGAAHSLASRFGALAQTDLYPAVDDPKFAGSGLDSGYITTVPGTRVTLFYSLPDADPAVIASDEARKDVASATEFGTALPIVPSTATLAIQVPVLDILGSNDLTTCGPNAQGVTFDCSSGAVVAAQEAPFYAPQARIHACVVPGSGHAISLALNHELQVADAVAWSDAFVGQNQSGQGSQLGASDNRLPPDCG